MERHIYKIGVHELWKESYNFRAVRRADKLYLFVDGRELGALDIRYLHPASDSVRRAALRFIAVRCIIM